MAPHATVLVALRRHRAAFYTVLSTAAAFSVDVLTLPTRVTSTALRPDRWLELAGSAPHLSSLRHFRHVM
eukprot:4997496-Prymnesium_polylepis.1